MNVMTMFCPNCQKKTIFVEELDDTFLNVWHCMVCGGEQRPKGNSMVPV